MILNIWVITKIMIVFFITENSSFIQRSQLKLPVKFFIFDTSALYSSDLSELLILLNNGEYLYPYFIMKESHDLEEKKKRTGESNKVTIFRKNLDAATPTLQVIS